MGIEQKKKLKVIEVPKYYKGKLQKQTYSGFDFLFY